MRSAQPLQPPPRGRGAQTNRSGRFEPRAIEAFDDGWTEMDDPAPPLRTQLTAERARTIISRNDSPDVGFDRSINTYRGCEHGCMQYPFRTDNTRFFLTFFGMGACFNLTLARISSTTPLERC